MSLNDKQTLLKQLIKKIGWNQKKFAGNYFCHQNESGSTKDQRLYEEKFKKYITRNTTSEELIDSYLDYFFSLREAKDIEYLQIYNNTSYDFSKKFNERMRIISKKINDELS